MSVLIKGMEMPEHCGECKLKAEYDDETFCPFFSDNVEYWIAAGRRHEDCPLGYIRPHGDLIDRDTLLINVDPAIHEDYVDSSGIILIASTVIQGNKLNPFPPSLRQRRASDEIS